MSPSILGNMLGGGGSGSVLGGVTTSATEYPRELKKQHFDEFGGDVKDDQYYRVGRLRLDAGIEMSFGYGTADQPENQGFIFADLRDDEGNSLDGNLQLEYRNSTGRGGEVVRDFDLEEISASKSDRSQKKPLPEVERDPQERDEYLELYVQLDEGEAEVSYDESEIVVPVTEYDVSG